MTPVQIPGANAILSAPKDWDTKANGPCEDLHTMYDNASGTFTSFWKPSKEELARLADGEYIIFTCFAAGHPVIALAVTTHTAALVA